MGRDREDNRCNVRVMANPRKIVIVGGGIGGLTAALSLLKRGLDVEVYEQAPELKECGRAAGPPRLCDWEAREPTARATLFVSNTRARFLRLHGAEFFIA